MFIYHLQPLVKISIFGGGPNIYQWEGHGILFSVARVCIWIVADNKHKRALEVKLCYQSIATSLPQFYMYNLWALL